MGLLGAWNDSGGRRVTMRDHGRSGNGPDWGTPATVLGDVSPTVAQILGFQQDGDPMNGIGRYGPDDE